MESVLEAPPLSIETQSEVIPDQAETVPVEGGNPEVIHDIPREVLEFTQSLWIDKFKYYKDGLIVLENLPLTKVKTILGLGFDNESTPTGLRFHRESTPTQPTVTSEPFFSGMNPIPEDTDIDQHTSGKLHVTMGENQYRNTTVEVDVLNTGTDKVYQVSIIPDAQMGPEQTLLYYQSAANHVSG